MVDRFYSGYDFRQLRVLKVNVLDQFSLCIRWSGDENCAGVCDRFGDRVKIVAVRRCVSAPDRVCFVMDVPGRIIRVQNQFINVCRIEMKHARFAVINPDHRMIMMFGHGMCPFPPICEHEIRTSEKLHGERGRDQLSSHSIALHLPGS